MNHLRSVFFTGSCMKCAGIVWVWHCCTVCKTHKCLFIFRDVARPISLIGQRSVKPVDWEGAMVIGGNKGQYAHHFLFFCFDYFRLVPTGSPSSGGDVAVYVFDINQPSLPTPFYFCSCVCFCLKGPFNCISCHKFSWQLSAFCSSGLISALLVLSTIYLFIKVSFSLDTIL